MGRGAQGDLLWGDFGLYHPEGDPPDLIIQSAPHNPTHARVLCLVSNIKNHYPFQTIVVFDPKEYGPEAQQWLHIQTGDQLIQVFNLEQFAEWAHRTWEG